MGKPKRKLPVVVSSLPELSGQEQNMEARFIRKREIPTCQAALRYPTYLIYPPNLSPGISRLYRILSNFV